MRISELGEFGLIALVQRWAQAAGSPTDSPFQLAVDNGDDAAAITFQNAPVTEALHYRHHGGRHPFHRRHHPLARPGLESHRLQHQRRGGHGRPARCRSDHPGVAAGHRGLRHPRAVRRHDRNLPGVRNPHRRRRHGPLPGGLHHRGSDRHHRRRAHVARRRPAGAPGGRNRPGGRLCRRPARIAGPRQPKGERR